MRNIIIKKLRKIEQTENVRILLAVESGSRAWGFASPDSDYDVRFVYVRQREDYLRLDEIRDVIDLTINGILDSNGWDLRKTLRLLHKSNPTLFEWFSSPIVYIKTDFSRRFQIMMRRCFSRKRSLWHYVSMAEGTFREFLNDETVKAKKYFYVLRPVLACRWILDKGTPPPMLFAELVDAELRADLRPAVERLLTLKINSPEIREIPRIEEINLYLELGIKEIKRRIAEMKEAPETDWNELNSIFLSEIERK